MFRNYDTTDKQLFIFFVVCIKQNTLKYVSREKKYTFRTIFFDCHTKTTVENKFKQNVLEDMNNINNSRQCGNFLNVSFNNGVWYIV